MNKPWDHINKENTMYFALLAAVTSTLIIKGCMQDINKGLAAGPTIPLIGNNSVTTERLVKDTGGIALFLLFLTGTALLGFAVYGAL